MKFVYALLLGLLALPACGFEVVDTGNRGVYTNFGKVVGEPLDEGLHFYNPFTGSIIELDVRVQKMESTVECYTKDVQKASIKYALNYSPDKTKIHVLYQQVGRDYAERLIPQTVEGAMKEVVGTWNAVDLVSQRGKALEEVTRRVAEELKQKDIFVTGIQMTNIDYDDQFEKAVEAKVTAIQRAEEAKNNTVKVEEEAKQKVIAAEAEAKSMQIRSEALSKNQALVGYEAVQKWNGVLPTYMMGSSVPFMNVKLPDQK